MPRVWSELRQLTMPRLATATLALRQMTPATLTLLPLLLLASCATRVAAAPWTNLFDGKSLHGWQVTKFGGEGEVRVQDDAIHLEIGNPLTGINLLGTPPTEDYELEVTAARLDGTDFFCGLTFPVGDRHLTLVLGGWGGSLSGLSSLDGDDASNNETRALKGFQAGRDYTATVRVTKGAVMVLLDGKPFLDVERAKHEFSLRPEVELCRPLGIASFCTLARVKTVRWRPLVAN